MAGKQWTRPERRALAQAATTVSRRLDEWDPFSVYSDPDDGPLPGEYDRLVWPLLRLLADGESAERITTWLHEAMAGLGLNVPDASALAASLRTWWDAEREPTVIRPEPPSCPAASHPSGAKHAQPGDSEPTLCGLPPDQVVIQRHLFYGDESSDCEVCAVRVWTLSREGG